MGSRNALGSGARTSTSSTGKAHHKKPRTFIYYVTLFPLICHRDPVNLLGNNVVLKSQLAYTNIELHLEQKKYPLLAIVMLQFLISAIIFYFLHQVSVINLERQCEILVQKLQYKKKYNKEQYTVSIEILPFYNLLKKKISHGLIFSV
ncbi:hypothetical protein BpHYR1_012441 [Brachionus plicatilis]|uniref:Uncharacterized protein n=1 Tax=Brachionus plicatilis TaxID=10195 RepID=A0A3M7SW36_BRAPC|nr:hypothetical protein BpHYR1_012441 [Brachionus plicatilis]